MRNNLSTTPFDRRRQHRKCIRHFAKTPAISRGRERNVDFIYSEKTFLSPEVDGQRERGKGRERGMNSFRQEKTENPGETLIRF